MPFTRPNRPDLVRDDGPARWRATADVSGTTGCDALEVPVCSITGMAGISRHEDVNKILP